MKSSVEAYIAALKEFGRTQLNLRFDGSFSRISTDEFSCNWVYACKPDSLASVFDTPRPFEFYADEAAGRNRYHQLMDDGLDAYFYHAEAHGGGNCPITRDLLKASRARIGYVVLHEAWHTTCRIGKYHLPYPLEESTGRIMGLFGAIAYARSIDDTALLQEAINQEKAWQLFADFINSSWDELTTLYAANPGPEVIASCKETLKKRAAQLQNILPASWEKGELAQPINNAFIARYHDYTLYYPQARAHLLAQNSSLTAAMTAFADSQNLLWHQK